MSSSPAVGIDLGTTFSCVAVVKNGQVITIYNGQGNYVTPSWVTFTDEDILVGEPARIAAAGNAKNAIFNAKRLIGRSYADWHRDYQAEIPRWPFKVVNQDGKPIFQAKYKGRLQYFPPEQISSHILKDLKKSAEDFLQQPVKDAVISVPANFDYAQREATEKAARLAGFNVLRLCSEPAMAGIMHEPLKNIYIKKTMLVFDCGGGTTDVAILSISEDGTYDIMSTAGNMNLGGENLVDRLVSHFLQKLKEETGKDYGNNEEAVRRLKRACDEAKCQLSFAEATTICFDYQCEPKSWKLTRARFNTLMADLFDKMLEPVKEAIEGAGLVKSQIDEVLLAGGTSRILDVQARLAAFFEGKPLRKSVNPEQAIAQGAAVMAAVLSGDTSSTLVGRQLCEVAPLSLNIRLLHDELIRFVPRSTSLPFTATRRLCTAEDNQSAVSFKVYEGERALSTDCKAGFLGEFLLRDLPVARQGEVGVNVTMTVNASGILQVTAVEPTTGKSAFLQLMSANRQRDSRTVKAMIEDAERNSTVDALHRKRLDVLKAFRSYVFDEKHREEDEKGRNSPVLAGCEEVIKWIDKCGPTATMEEIRSQQFAFQSGRFSH